MTTASGLLNYRLEEHFLQRKYFKQTFNKTHQAGIIGEHEGQMVHPCCELTAVSSSLSICQRQSDVSEDSRDGCIDMRQLQCQTQGKPRRGANVCEEERAH